MKALDCLNEIQSRYVNSGEIDWEALLEYGYRRFLDRDSVVLDVGDDATFDRTDMDLAVSPDDCPGFH